MIPKIVAMVTRLLWMLFLSSLEATVLPDGLENSEFDEQKYNSNYLAEYYWLMKNQLVHLNQFIDQLVAAYR